MVSKPRRQVPAGNLAKRTFDLFFASLGLLVLSPLLLGIALAIKLRDGGTVFYRGVRAGYRGRPFRIFKFRTMVPDADKIGGSSTPEDDPRITPIGKFLRRSKMDELPQLINVVLGEMSLVGPRPQVMWAVALYTDEEKEILAVRPGITDESSIAFRNEGEILRGSTNPDKTYLEKIAPKKIRLQLHYAREHNLRMDIGLVFKTIAAICGFTEEGAGFEAITEQWGMPASPEQASMAYTRYHWAAREGDGLRVFEVACGSGMGLPFLAHRSAAVIGGDYAWPNISIARTKCPPTVPLLQIDAQSLPFKDGSLDVVVCFEAFYYLERQKRFLDECRRVLIPGGKLLLCMPNRERPGFVPSPFSTTYPTAPELRNLMESARFSPKIHGAYRLQPASIKDSIGESVRSLANSLGLVPRTLRGRALLKRLVHRGRLTRLEGIQDGMAPEETLVLLEDGADLRSFKNLYALGIAR